jgi:hypothetical protein
MIMGRWDSNYALYQQLLQPMSEVGQKMDPSF